MVKQQNAAAARKKAAGGRNEASKVRPPVRGASPRGASARETFAPASAAGSPEPAPRKPAEPAPRKKDAQRSQATILRVATREFSERGFDGARVDRIAEKGKLSKNLLYHYFGSKQRLYLAVLHRAIADLRHAQEDAEVRAMEPVAGMRRLVHKTFGYFRDHPHIIRLLATENMLKGRNISKSPEIIALYNPLLETIAILLEKGERQGVFRRGVDPQDLYISIAGLSIFYFSNRYTLSVVFDTDLGARPRVAQRERHMTDMILGFLCSGLETAEDGRESGGERGREHDVPSALEPLAEGLSGRRRR